MDHTVCHAHHLSLLSYNLAARHPLDAQAFMLLFAMSTFLKLSFAGAVQQNFKPCNGTKGRRLVLSAFVVHRQGASELW